ncbi:hypothetical protein J6590_022587 [Homalodisca vitripennis]|nr:hypothetical protein J6590_022587 [Homalodisca vitripennis]
MFGFTHLAGDGQDRPGIVKALIVLYTCTNPELPRLRCDRDVVQQWPRCHIGKGKGQMVCRI